VRLAACCSHNRTAKMPVASLTDLRGVTPWLWVSASLANGTYAMDHPMGC
jgi:hypothetical protein